VGLRVDGLVVDELLDNIMRERELLEAELEPRDDEQDEVVHGVEARDGEVGPDKGDDADWRVRAAEREEALVKDLGHKAGHGKALHQHAHRKGHAEASERHICTHRHVGNQTGDCRHWLTSRAIDQHGRGHRHVSRRGHDD